MTKMLKRAIVMAKWGCENSLRNVSILILLLWIWDFSLHASLRNTTSADESPASFKAHHPFVIFSPPKCGTHLFGKALSLLLNETPAYYLSGISDTDSIVDALNTIAYEGSRGHFVVAHHFTNTMLKILVKKGYKIIFIVRDPRDQLISIGLYGGTATFRDGSIGKWKRYFSLQQKQQFKQRYGFLLERLGYEEDSNW